MTYSQEVHDLYKQLLAAHESPPDAATVVARRLGLLPFGMGLVRFTAVVGDFLDDMGESPDAGSPAVLT